MPPAATLCGVVLAYPIWSWQQLRRTAGALERELGALSRGLSVEPETGAPSTKLALDFISCLLPVRGGSLWDPSRRLRLSWDRPHASDHAVDSRVLLETELADGMWRVEFLWLGAAPPTPGERLLLETSAHRLAGLASAPPAGGRRRLRRGAPIEFATARLHALRHFIVDSLTDMPEGVLIADSSGWILLANRQVARLGAGAGSPTQRPARARPRRPARRALDAQPEERRILAQGLRAALIHKACLRLAARNAAGRDLLVQMAPFGRDAPIASGVIVNIADITGLAEDDQRRVGRMLFEAEQRALVTLHSIADAVIFVDPRGRIEYLNRAAERLTGYPVHEARGRPVGQVVRAVDEGTREPVALPSPQELEHDMPARLKQPCVLISRWGQEAFIKVSAALLDSHDGEIMGTVVTLSDITEARLLAARVTHQATHDALTGDAQPRAARGPLRLAIARSRRYGARLAVLFIDLDRFKTVNDGFGHNVGDQLLRAGGRAAARAAARGGHARPARRRRVRGGRRERRAAGGGRPARRQAARCLRRALRARAGRSSTSAPRLASRCSRRTARTSTSLLKSADQAMYRAKEHPRQHPPPGAAAAHAGARPAGDGPRPAPRARARRVRAAVPAPARARERAHRRRRGAGALAPRRARPVPPDGFIGHAEQSGLIIAIDEWVLAEACAQARRWQDGGLPACASRSTCRPASSCGATSAGWSRTRCRRRGSRPRASRIEITESTFVADLPRAPRQPRGAAHARHRARDRRLRHRLLVAELPARVPDRPLKIDRSLVQDADGARGGVILKAVVELAHGLRLRALAEGVETRAQLEAMRRLGCDELQGKVFASACPEDEITPMLQRNAAALAAIVA